MSVDFSRFLISEGAGEKITPMQHNTMVDAMQAAVNHITGDQVLNASLSSSQIEGGAVPLDAVTATGEANKIPRLDSDGNLILVVNASLKVVNT